MSGEPSPTSGKRIILVTLTGVILVGAAIMVGFLWLSPKAQACANGPDALNPTQTPGVFLPQERKFDTIPQAERWICHSIAYPRSPDLTLSGVTAFRSSSLQNVVEGEGYAEVNLTYLHPSSGKTVELRVTPYIDPAELASRDQIDLVVRPLDANSVPLPRLETTWQSQHLDFRLRGQGGGGLTQSDFDAIRNSVR